MFKKAMLIITLILVLAIPGKVQAATKSFGVMTAKTVKTKKGNYKVKVYWKGERIATYKFQEKPKVKFIYTDMLDYEMLTERKEKNILYIEINYGTCLNANGDGKIDTIDSYYNYISYRSMEGVKAGDRIITYCIYNPYTTWYDDIAERYDDFLA